MKREQQREREREREADRQTEKQANKNGDGKRQINREGVSVCRQRERGGGESDRDKRNRFGRKNIR